MKITKFFLQNSKTWINRHTNDIYVKMSYQNNLRSRAIFKFDEIQQKYSLIKSSSLVLGFFFFLN